jgi:hypothetical protein
MALFVNKTEIENVYLNGMQLDHIYVNGMMVYESTIFVDKPTISGTYTYNGAKQSVAISGYDGEAMTIGGVYAATEAGTYTVTFTPKKGYAWLDETTTPVSYTWSIEKLALAVPALSATWFAWVEGNSHSVVVKGINTAYINQSGDLTQTDTSSNIGSSHTVTWTLKNTASCKWKDDGSNGKKTATWKVEWSNGTSHYKNDVYNSGWGLANITPNSKYIAGYVTSNNMIEILSNKDGYTVIRTNSAFAAGRTVHMIVRAHNAYSTDPSDATLLRVKACSTDSFSSQSLKAATGYKLATQSTEWTEIAGVMGDYTPNYGFGLSIIDTEGGDIKRIWVV